MTRPPLVLCSGSLGTVPLDAKFRAAASAGFDLVSVYGQEYWTGVQAGVDFPTLLMELDLGVAEVDGVAISLRRPELFDDALTIARALHARSVTVVETEPYDPGDETQVTAAVEAFSTLCDAAAADDILVHIEPFSWSSLGRVTDALAIVASAGRANGGVLLDLWHHTRGPDGGKLDPGVGTESLFGIQLADTLAEPWPNVRDECMHQRLLPGDGHAALAGQLTDLAARGPLPPIGIEVFGDALSGLSPDAAARTAFEATQRVLDAAGL